MNQCLVYGLDNYNRRLEFISCIMIIVDLSMHLKKRFNNYAEIYAKKIIEIIRNPEVDTKLKSRSMIAMKSAFIVLNQ